MLTPQQKAARARAAKAARIKMLEARLDRLVERGERFRTGATRTRALADAAKTREQLRNISH